MMDIQMNIVFLEVISYTSIKVVHFQMRWSNIVYLLQDLKYLLFEFIQVILSLFLWILILLFLIPSKTGDIQKESLLLVFLIAQSHFPVDDSIDI